MASLLRRHPDRPLTGEAVAAAAAAGDELARTVLLGARAALASAAVDIVNIFNPERLVLGGSVILGNPDWVTEARRDVGKRALEPARGCADVVAAELGDEGGLLGAALLFDRHEQPRLAT
jgi:glucokinase